MQTQRPEREPQEEPGISGSVAEAIARAEARARKREFASALRELEYAYRSAVEADRPEVFERIRLVAALLVEETERLTHRSRVLVTQTKGRSAAILIRKARLLSAEADGPGNRV